MKTLASIRDFLFKYGYILLIICIGLLIGKALSQSKKIDEVNGNNKALQDTLHITYDKYHEQTSTIQALNVQKVGDLQKIYTKDKTILLLQHFVDSLVKSGKRITTATVIDNYTKDDEKTKTDIITQPGQPLSGDTTKNGIRYVTVYPIYHTKWVERWSVGEIYATKDSITRNIRIINEYETSVMYERKNIFSPWVSTVMIKNINPNTYTTDIRSVLVSPKTSRWGLGTNLGGLYDPFQRKMSWGIQIGINYNFITF